MCSSSRRLIEPGSQATPPLAPAVRQLHQGALPAHEHRERGDFGERDAGMVADTALGGPEDRAVMDPVAEEHFRPAVVHARGHADHQRPPGIPEALVHSGIERQPLGDRVQLLERGAIRFRALERALTDRRHTRPLSGLSRMRPRLLGLCIDALTREGETPQDAAARRQPDAGRGAEKPRGGGPARRLAAMPDTPASTERLERETGFEPATPTLARSCSTPELFPLDARDSNRALAGGSTRAPLTPVPAPAISPPGGGSARRPRAASG